MYKIGKYILYKEHMNFRLEPRVNSKAIGIIPMGTCIEVTEIKDNWGKIRIMNKEGWCCISECFAKPVCLCENNDCCYYERFLNLEKEYCELQSKFNKINELLK